MRPAVAISEAGGRIMAEPAPVALLDTCALLDILRVPLRSELPDHVVRDAIEMLTKTLAKPRALWCIAAPWIDVEWADNREKVIGDLSTSIKRIDALIPRLRAAWEIVGAAPELARGLSIPPETHFGPLELPARLVDISEEMLGNALWLQPDPDCLVSADARSCAGKKPAATGKREQVDCCIIETYFALCRLLRANHFAERCVFISSNTKDFYSSGSPIGPHADLASDCAAAGVEFALNFSHAVSILFSLGNPN